MRSVTSEGSSTAKSFTEKEPQWLWGPLDSWNGTSTSIFFFIYPMKYLHLQSGLTQILVQTFILPAGWILMTLLIPGLFLWQHHEADICGSKWNVWTTVGWITMQFGADIQGFFSCSIIMKSKFQLVQSKTVLFSLQWSLQAHWAASMA